MSESEGLVTRVDGDYITIEVAALPSACGKCGDKGGCGKAEAGPRHYEMRNTIAARAGDRVVISVTDGAVLRAAALSYLMPLAFVFAGALFGARLGSEGLAPVIGAALGLVAGIGLLRLADAWFAGRREPMLALRLKSRVFNIDKDVGHA